MLVVPAFAAYTNYSGQFFYVSYIDGQRKDVIVQSPHTGGTTGVPISSGYLPAGTHNITMQWAHISPGVPISGAVGFYYSYYYEFPGATSLQQPDLSYHIPYISLDTGSESARFNFSENTGSIVPFSAPVIDGSMVSRGWVFKGRTPYLETINPVAFFFMNAGLNGKISPPAYTYTSDATSYPILYTPSATVIISDVVTLDWMECLADSLTGDSDTLTALYADVMSILNDMYAVMGDQLAVERAIKGYFETLLPLVESIDANTANIYSLLQTQFQLLRTLIATESDDIQAAIEKQTEDLKAYFDSVFSGAVGDMPEKSDDLETSVGDYSSSEQQYQSDAVARFDELASTFSGFSGGTLSGITLASTLFSRVWNALGEYSIVYYFPLLLGLSLVIVGRLSRGSGGQSSAEKHRGDSSA